MVPDAIRLGCFKRVTKLETLRIEAKCSAIQGSAGNGILTRKSIPYTGRDRLYPSVFGTWHHVRILIFLDVAISTTQ